MLLLTIASALQPGHAAEIDSVTARNLELANSLSAINEIFNQRIKQGIEKANPSPGNDLEDKHCDEEVLYTELRKAVFQSLTASWGLKGYDLDKQLRELLSRYSYALPLNDSIYRDIDYIEGFSLNLKELSHVVDINGHLVGLDKIGHFFAEGWRYFDLTQFDDHDMLQAFDWGRRREAGRFGYSTTGIFSYADLTANFNGWRFWNRISLKQDDPLKGMLASFFDRPYVSCKVQIMDSLKKRRIIRAWEQNAPFDLSDYVDGAWDEGNNCNSYADPIIEAKVVSRVKAVDADFRCPYQPKHCLKAREKYGAYAKYLLHPNCLTIKNK